MVKPHMSNPRARRAIRDRHAVVEREERQANRRARRAIAYDDDPHPPAGPCGIVGCGVLRDYHDDLDHEWSASFVPGDTGGFDE